MDSNLPDHIVGFLMRLAEEAKLHKDPTTLDTINAISLSGDGELANDYAEFLRLKIVDEVTHGVPFTPPNLEELETLAGQRPIGFGIAHGTDYPVAHGLDKPAEHTLIIGKPGMGKTTLQLMIAAQAVQYGVAVWGFERSKPHLRTLAGMSNNVTVFHENEKLKWNLFEVHPPITPHLHIRLFVETFCSEFNVADLGQGILHRAIHEEFDCRGIFRGGDNFTTLKRVRDRIASFTHFLGQKITPGTNLGSSRNSLLVKINAMLLGNEERYGYVKGYSIAELANMSFVNEMRDMPDQEARIFLEMMLYSLIYYAVATNRMHRRMVNLICIDEAKWCVPKDRPKNKRFSPITHILSEGPESGVCLCLADQTTALDPACFKYSGIKLIFGLADGADMDCVAKTLVLNQDQFKHLGKLPVGQAVARIGYSDPILMHTVDIPRH